MNSEFIELGETMSFRGVVLICAIVPFLLSRSYKSKLVSFLIDNYDFIFDLIYFSCGGFYAFKQLNIFIT